MDARKKAKAEKKLKSQMQVEQKRVDTTFPSHLGIPKTDEPRIQSAPELLEAFKGKPYYATLKYDGSSATYCFDITKPNENSYEFCICSRNYISPESYYDRAEKIYDIRNKLQKAGHHIAIQCEIYGPKIAKNPLQKKELSIAVFNVFDINEKRFFDLDEMEKFCKEYDLPLVEILEKGENFNYASVEELIQLAKGNYEGTNNPREGVVFRTQKEFHIIYDEEEICDQLGNISLQEKLKHLEKLKRKSFKIINDDYLISKK